MTERWQRVGDFLALLLLFYLIWIPLPFGSVTAFSQFLLILPPLYLVSWTLLMRLLGSQQEATAAVPAAQAFWTGAALILLVAGALQLLPLPGETVDALSPVSAQIQDSAAKVLLLLDVRTASELRTLSVHPEGGLKELLRVAAYFAVFQAALLLFRTRRWRQALAIALVGSALVQVAAATRQFSSTTYMVWDWENIRLGGHSRVSGTYVSPNHFAHYLALILPLASYLALSSWRRRGRTRETPLNGFLTSGGLLLFAVGATGALTALAGILLSRSRGALLALLISVSVCAVCWTFAQRKASNTRRRQSKWSLRLQVISLAVLVVLAVSGLAFLVGFETLSRFNVSANEAASLGGRLTGARAALGVVALFHWTGSGLGTFANVVLMAQATSEFKFDHAHNDYLELIATVGIPAGTSVILLLVLGYVALMRSAVSAVSAEVSGERRRFLFAVLTSITVAVVHAFYDFNFHIPANAATLAAIAGAGVASLDYDTHRTAAAQRFE